MPQIAQSLAQITACALGCKYAKLRSTSNFLELKIFVVSCLISDYGTHTYNHLQIVHSAFSALCITLCTV